MGNRIRIFFALIAICLAQIQLRAASPFEETMAWMEFVAAPMSGAGVYAGHKHIFLGLESRSNENVCFHCPNDKYFGLRSIKFGATGTVDGLSFGASLGAGRYKVSDWAFDSTSRSESRIFRTETAIPLEGQIAVGWDFVKIGAKLTLLYGLSPFQSSAAIYLAIGVLGGTPNRTETGRNGE